LTIGDQFSYTVTVTNDNSQPGFVFDATGVELTDVLPLGLNYIDYAATAGAYNSLTGLWSVGNLANGATAELTITVEVDGEVIGGIENVAEVTAADQPDVDSTPDNNDGDESEDDEDNEVVIVEQEFIDLELTKSGSTTVAGLGDVFTYTLTLCNNPGELAGLSDATGVTVSDLIPGNLTFLGASASEGIYSYATGVWTVGNLDNGDCAEVEMTVQMAIEGLTTNTAQVSAADQDDIDSVPANDNGDQSEDDEDSWTVSPPADLIDLDLTKVVNATQVTVGDLFTYTLTVLNEGPDAGTGIIVTDNLPAGLDFESSNGNYNPLTGQWFVGNLAVGASASIDIIVSVEEIDGPIVNVAEVSAHDQEDIDSEAGNDDGDQSEDDEDSATVFPTADPIADLSLEKVVSESVVALGDEIAYTLTITNEGPDAATGVTVLDNLPSSVSYLFSTGNYSPSTGLWTVGSLASGEALSIDIWVAVVDLDGELNNFAQVNSSDQEDPDSDPGNDTDNTSDEDDEDNAPIIPEDAPVIDLSLEKVVNATTVSVGDQFTYTISVLNSGPDDATGVAVTDELPAGLAYVSSDGLYNPSNGLWFIGDLANGASTSLDIEVLVLEIDGPIVNVAEVSAYDQEDIDSEAGNDDGDQSEDDEDSVTVFPTADPIADLSLEKVVSESVVALGDEIAYTLTITNEGPDAATGVTVLDNLPSSVSYLFSTGNYSPSTGLWTVGSLASGEALSIDIWVAVVDLDGELNNFAQVNSSDQEDPDSDPGNDTDNTSDEDDEDNATIAPEEELGSIGDYVWHDDNQDGVQDAGEEGIPNVVVTLVNPDGSTETTTTDADGLYLFDDLPEGDYTVIVGDGPTDWFNTTAPIHTVDLSEGEDYEDADFGFDGVDLGSIGDYVWLDENTDGVQDPGENGIPNVEVTLTYPDGSTVTTTTDADGLYLFDDLPEGDYIVTVGTGPDGTFLTTAGTDEVSLSVGEDYVDADFGFDGEELGSIGDYVWLDDNGDGVQDPGEDGIPNVEVTLTYADGTTITTTTDADGEYLFDNLPAGDYEVTVGTGPDDSFLTTPGADNVSLSA
ncbi:carboxypeptidase regulatory-like domain-containing protein, partial [Chitinophagales bacterium]|nr:carboxypeptidase regulatory-like domain-containing protein [Chitinophagales bacterium]